METAGTLFLIWTMHAVIGAALSAPILFFGRKRIGWASWELLALIVPFFVWVVLMLSPLAAGRKSLANLGEPAYIGLAMPGTGAPEGYHRQEVEREGLRNQFHYRFERDCCRGVLYGSIQARMSAKSNKRGAGKGGIAVLLHAGRAWPALPECKRYA